MHSLLWLHVLQIILYALDLLSTTKSFNFLLKKNEIWNTFKKQSVILKTPACDSPAVRSMIIDYETDSVEVQCQRLHIKL